MLQRRAFLPDILQRSEMGIGYIAIVSVDAQVVIRNREIENAGFPRS